MRIQCFHEYTDKDISVNYRIRSKPIKRQIGRADTCADRSVAR
jgi:hypothetical protein